MTREKPTCGPGLLQRLVRRACAPGAARGCCTTRSPVRPPPHLL